MTLKPKELKKLLEAGENAQGTYLASKLMDLLRENKLYATLFAIGGLHLLRYVAANRCQQGLITFLQALSAGGYLGSELEGEAQNAVVAAALLVGGGMATFDCLTEAGWEPGGVIVGAKKGLPYEPPRPWEEFARFRGLEP